jgi:hypothetical protein|tara:strand:+ start:132 stop:365 length:234 start_codon:yes stop_codon:yes gene_type:complete
MKIMQYKKDGSARIEFSELEIKIINEKKCFELPAESLKHIVNNLMSIIVNFQENFPEDIKKLNSLGGGKDLIKPKDE